MGFFVERKTIMKRRIIFTTIFAIYNAVASDQLDYPKEYKNSNLRNLNCYQIEKETFHSPQGIHVVKKETYEYQFSKKRSSYSFFWGIDMSFHHMTGTPDDEENVQKLKENIQLCLKKDNFNTLPRIDIDLSFLMLKHLIISGCYQMNLSCLENVSMPKLEILHAEDSSGCSLSLRWMARIGSKGSKDIKKISLLTDRGCQKEDKEATYPRMNENLKNLRRSRSVHNDTVFSGPNVESKNTFEIISSHYYRTHQDQNIVYDVRYTVASCQEKSQLPFLYSSRSLICSKKKSHYERSSYYYQSHSDFAISNSSELNNFSFNFSLLSHGEEDNNIGSL